MNDLGVHVILAAHGAGSGSRANELVMSLARAVQQQAIGARVTAAFRKGVPMYRAALEQADCETCIVVPVLTSEGYFAADLRREVTLWSRARHTLVARPIGASRALIDAVSHRVGVEVQRTGATARNALVIVVGHGTARHRDSGTATRQAALGIGERTGLTTVAAFLDQDPTIEAALSRVVDNTAVIVVPFLLGGGDHANADVPARAAGAGKPDRNRIVILPPLGELAELPDVVAATVREVLERRRVPRAVGRVLVGRGGRCMAG